ncbi:hypothetical protein F2Q69_00035412 [Brassica cretica]|uniref:Uncharacterized protein n=1 Tax=Brassica cretica TaxID=69181 RepID=A0A8S9SKZ3_BRACR|nr:hypothetical protein F2Q69_00035412 [Brassica cretica]
MFKKRVRKLKLGSSRRGKLNLRQTRYRQDKRIAAIVLLMLKPEDSDGHTAHTASRLPSGFHIEDPDFDAATLSANSHTKEATKLMGFDERSAHTTSRLPSGYHIEDPAFETATLSANSHTKEATNRMVL